MLKKFICCHKDIPQNYLLNDDITLVSNRQVINQSQHKIIFTDGSKDDRLWSEISCFKTIIDNTSDGDFIQINHYRRLLLDNTERIVVANRMVQAGSNVIMYSKYHNADDLLNCAEIIKEKYPAYYPEYIEMINEQVLFPYNICTMPRDLFIKYYNFLNDILSALLEKYNISTYEEMLNHISNKYYIYLKDFSPNNSIEYQARMVSFLSERLSTAFFKHINKLEGYESQQIFQAPVKLLEKGQTI